MRIGNERRTVSIAVANQKIARLWDVGLRISLKLNPISLKSRPISLKSRPHKSEVKEGPKTGPSSKKSQLCGTSSKNLHNLHNLIKLLVFCCLRVGEVFVVRNTILLKIHDCKLVNDGDRSLIEDQTVAGLAETA